MDSGEEVLSGGEGSQEKILVSVRVRPLNEIETLNNDLSDWECINDNSIIYKNHNAPITERIMYPAVYTFDRVFGENCLTREVYEQGAKEVALAVVKGINSTVFAYGQTSSGKTHTMTGITKYFVEDIFEHMRRNEKFILEFSAMEIYNESVRDLLSLDAAPLRLLDDPERGTIVDKLMEDTISDQKHLLELLSICAAQRQIGETFLNENSSRSHQIIRLTVESSARELLGKGNLSTLTGIVNFVDLAGSERASQALAVGTRLKEGGYINRSLLTLSTVIRKLSHGRYEHIPYRDSKLTRILQASLGGNSKTAIICTISPTRTHVDQSRNTLSFATCAKEVTTSAQVNEVMSDKTLVKHLQRQLARLESEFRTPGTTSALLRQKDLQIEELEKEVKQLILQRDIAQSQVKEVLQLLEDDTDSEQQLGMGAYPNLRVRLSPESVNNWVTELLDSPEIDVKPCSAYIRHRWDNNLEETFLGVSAPPRVIISDSNYSETDSVPGGDESEIKCSVIPEDLYKEVSSSEIEARSKNPDKFNYPYPDKHVTFSQFNVVVSDNKENQRSLQSMTNKNGEIRSPKVNIDIDKDGGTRSLSRSLVDKKIQDFANKSSLDEDAGHSDSCQLLKEKNEHQLVKEVTKDLGKADDKNVRLLPVQSLKDVGLNNTKDEYRNLQSWPAEFKRIQKEIIDLWQSCHVSLLHRTYFFLLFQGDPLDAVHMAVELRILTNLKDTFARGEKAVIRGKKVSLESSKKDLRQERRMLSMQMLKNLSDEERDTLFLKWKIGVGTKLRRIQLAHRLWANTEDMNHIYDSAYLVAKLMGFIEKDQIPKETFSLGSAPQPLTRRKRLALAQLPSP